MPLPHKPIRPPQPRGPPHPTPFPHLTGGAVSVPAGIMFLQSTGRRTTQPTQPIRKDPNMRLRKGQYETSVPTVSDRVVQAALKLVLEPIFETDFEPVSYGFRPARRAHDAIAEIHLFGTAGYRWVLDADIEACLTASTTRP
jgi:Reverse transcriptase (RNA-dependent DNA polymerase)